LLGANAMLRYCVTRIPAGWVGLQRSDRGLTRCTLAEADRADAAAHVAPGATEVEAADDPLFAEATALLERYFRPESVQFDLPLDLEGYPPFRAAVLRACAAIPYGETRTYGELAAEAGSPGAARAVGQAMRCNVLAPVVPCHRVIGTGGKLVGYGGKARALDAKQRMLDLEQRGLRTHARGERTPPPAS